MEIGGVQKGVRITQMLMTNMNKIMQKEVIKFVDSSSGPSLCILECMLRASIERLERISHTNKAFQSRSIYIPSSTTQHNTELHK